MVGAEIGKSIEAAASRLGESIDRFSMSVFLCGVMAFAPHKMVTWIITSIAIIEAMIVVLMPAVPKIFCKMVWTILVSGRDESVEGTPTILVDDSWVG